MIEAIDDCEVAGEAEDGLEAKKRIDALAPDLVLLDIRMPGLDGLSLVRQEGGQLPPIIFTTAYDEYAVEAFDAEAVDYLLKPVEPERLQRALERARRRMEGQSTDPEPNLELERLVERLKPSEPPRLTAKRGDTVYFFDPRHLSFLHSEYDYVSFVVRGKKFLLLETLESLEKRLAQWDYLRIHRSYLVNIKQVVGLRTENGSAVLVMSDGQTAPISRRRLPEVRRSLGIEAT